MESPEGKLPLEKYKMVKNNRFYRGEKHLEAHRERKIGGAMIMFTALFIFLCVILFTPTISALEFDNVKDYNSETKTMTITNTFGLGGKIAEIKLNTEQHRYVMGGDYVAEIEINNVDDYNNWHNKMEFYEKSSPYSNIGDEIIGKSFTYKYLL